MYIMFHYRYSSVVNLITMWPAMQSQMKFAGDAHLEVAVDLGLRVLITCSIIIFLVEVLSAKATRVCLSLLIFTCVCNVGM